VCFTNLKNISIDMYVLDEGRNNSELSISRHERVTEAYTQGLQLY